LERYRVKIQIKFYYAKTLRNTVTDLLWDTQRIENNYRKTFIDLGFRSGKWVPKTNLHINENHLENATMHAYSEQ